MSEPLTLLIVAEPRGHRRGQLLHRCLLRRQVDSRLLLLGPAVELAAQETCAELTSPEHIQWLLASLGWAATEFALAMGSEAFAYLPADCPHRLLDCQRVEQADRWKPKSLEALQAILEGWRGFKAPRVSHESRAVHESELIFTCNPLVRQVLISLYPRLAGKVHEPPLWLAPMLKEEQAQRPQRADPHAGPARAGSLEGSGTFSWEEEALGLETFGLPHPAEELMEVLPALR